MFNVAVPYAHVDYEADGFLRLLEPLGVSAQEMEYPFLVVPEHAIRQAEKKLEPLAGQAFIALFPGASIPERRWGTENFHRLATWLNEQGLAVVVVGGGQDREAGATILAEGLGLNLAGGTSRGNGGGVAAVVFAGNGRFRGAAHGGGVGCADSIPVRPGNRRQMGAPR
ncbi:MAG: glycosyltransferase family 9 protein [Syntrophotaleaceae bacterium]